MNTRQTPHQVAAEVAQETKASDAGVCLTVKLDGAKWVLWAIGTDGLIVKHELEIAHTPRARLVAHAQGFIANHRAAWAAVGATL
jgi:hypothetical protein